MPTLTQPDYRELRRAVFQDRETKDELKALPNLPDKAQLTAAFQIVEDDFTTFRQALRAKIAAALGIPTASLAPRLNRLILAHYCDWKRGGIFRE